MEFLKRPYILQVAAMVTAILIAFGVAIVAFTIYALATAQTLPVQFDRVGFVTCQSHSADRTYSNCPIADFALALADSFAGPDHDHGISIYHDHPGVHSPDGHEHPEYEPTVHSHVGVAQAANLQALRERVAVLEATEEHAHPEYVANAHEHEYTEEFTIEGVGDHTLHRVPGCVHWHMDNDAGVAGVDPELKDTVGTCRSFRKW